MSRESAALIIGGSVLGVVLVLGLIGLFGTTRSASEVGPIVAVPDVPADGSAGIVYFLREEPGESFFGLVQLRAARHYAIVGVVIPPQCIRSEPATGPVLLDDGECASLPARGPLTGGGRSANGVDFEFVELEVSRECFEALKPGDAWPPQHAACA